MSWEIKIPFQSRDQTISEAIEAHVDQSLEGEDRAIVFQLFLTSEFKTLGELIDHIESLDADGRRELLNKKRAELGLESVEDVEAHRRFEMANRRLRPGRDAEGKLFQGCAEPNCNAWPQDEQGQPIPVADRRWWCDRHRTRRDPTTTCRPSRSRNRLRDHGLDALGAEQERLIEEDRKREEAAAREQRRREEGSVCGNWKRSTTEPLPDFRWGGVRE